MERLKGKTVITMEIFQRTTIRSRKAADARCERCAAEHSPSETAAHQQIVRDVLQLAEGGLTNLLETEAVGCSFCRNSLPALEKEI